MDVAFFINSKGIDDPEQIIALRNQLHIQIRSARPAFWYILLRNAVVLSFFIAHIAWLLLSSLILFKWHLNFVVGVAVLSNIAICMSFIEGRSRVHDYIDRLVGEWRDIDGTLGSLGERDRMLKERLRDLNKGNLNYFESVWKRP